MWKRKITSPFCFLASVLLSTVVFSAAAPDRLASSDQFAQALPEIPQNCKASGTSDPLATLLQSTAALPTAEAYVSLGTFYGRQGRFGCAVAAFQAALRRNPQNQTRYELALALLENHEPQRAATELRAHPPGGAGLIQGSQRSWASVAGLRATRPGERRIQGR